MISINDLTDQNVLMITARDSITREDYQQLVPNLEDILEHHNKVRFFIELDGVSRFEPGALVEDFKLDVKYRNKYGKTAVVGDNRWEQYATELSNLLFDAPMQFFGKEQRETAWRWVNQ